VCRRVQDAYGVPHVWLVLRQARRHEYSARQQCVHTGKRNVHGAGFHDWRHDFYRLCPKVFHAWPYNLTQNWVLRTFGELFSRGPRQFHCSLGHETTWYSLQLSRYSHVSMIDRRLCRRGMTPECPIGTINQRSICFRLDPSHCRPFPVLTRCHHVAP
jgi:hypothetical protein